MSIFDTNSTFFLESALEGKKLYTNISLPLSFSSLREEEILDRLARRGRKTRFHFRAIYTRWGNRCLDLRVPGQEIENVNTWRGRRTNPARPSGRMDTQRRAGFSSADFTYLYSTFVCLPKHHISAPFTCVKVGPFACRRFAFAPGKLIPLPSCSSRLALKKVSSFLAERSLQDRSWMNLSSCK